MFSLALCKVVSASLRELALGGVHQCISSNDRCLVKMRGTATLSQTALSGQLTKRLQGQYGLNSRSFLAEESVK